MGRTRIGKLIAMGVIGGGARAFAPTDITGLALWLDASDADTLFQDAAGTTPATDDGHLVGLWKDKTANAYNAAVGADLNKRPSLQLNVQNGLPGVQGDGGDSLAFSGAALGLFRNKGYGVVFAVYSAGHTAAAIRNYMAFSSGSSGVQIRAGAYDGQTANRFSIGARRVDADTAVVAASSVDHSGIVHCIVNMYTWSGGTLSLRQDGVTVGGANLAASGNTSDTASVAAALLSNPQGGDQFSVGTLHELVVYTQALDAAQIEQVETYLKTKWGLSF